VGGLQYIPASGAGPVLFLDVNGDRLPDAVQSGYADYALRTYMTKHKRSAARRRCSRAAENDPLERPKSITDAKLGKTEYTYGPFDTLYTVKDPGGAITRTTRDAFGFVRKLDDPDRGSSILVRDGFGELVSSVDALSRKFSFEYDADDAALREIASSSLFMTPCPRRSVSSRDRGGSSRIMSMQQLDMRRLREGSPERLRESAPLTPSEGSFGYYCTSRLTTCE
jgi:YD repeat-containing protein